MYQLQDVWVKFGKDSVLENLHFSIPSGRLTGVVGPDGAGKTTLLKLLVGLLKPTQGQIVRGFRSIGFVSEHFGLYEEMNLLENLHFYGLLHGLDKQEVKQRSQELLQWANLDRFAVRQAGHLSGGMKRKLAIIAAIIHQPDCLVLDEPTHGVDPISRREIWKLMDGIKRSGASVIVSTQYLDEVARCDEVLFLYQGQVLKKENPQLLLQSFPYHVYQLPDMRQHSRKDLLSLKQHPGVIDAYARGVNWILLCEKRESMKDDLQRWKEERGIQQEWNPISPEFEDVFIYFMQERGGVR